MRNSLHINYRLSDQGKENNNKSERKAVQNNITLHERRISFCK